ncbi:MAG: hypothetical protein L0Y72_11635 [Gemmataceae bacterium]|nr:hypothetical protein [Gemmataceae bacterium]
MSTNTSNPGCYAQRLCDCRGPVNREHVVTDALLQAVWQDAKGGKVNGLTFLDATPDSPAQIGIKGLTAKILCERHNSALSPFDTEIVKFFKALERLVQSEHDGGPIARNDYITGDLVERWMLKTLLNGLFSGNFPAPFAESFARHFPPDEWLQMIYRNAPFPPGQGVYVSNGLGQVNYRTVFRLEVIGHQIGIVGLRMWMFGTLFTLVLTEASERDAFPELATATYRPAKIVSQKTRNRIVLSWAGSSTNTVLELRMSDKPFAETK